MLLTLLLISRFSISLASRAHSLPSVFIGRRHHHRSTSFLHPRLAITASTRHCSILTARFTFIMPPLNTAPPRRSSRLAKRCVSSVSEAHEISAKEDYSSMKVAELKQLLKQKGLGMSGNKGELISRLASNENDGQKISYHEQEPDSEKKKRASDNKKARISRTVTPNTDVSCTASSTKLDDKQKQQILYASNESVKCLPRTREMQLQSSGKDLMVIGVDEAGRGPLAGPLVAAAAIVPTNIAGVIDSKKITKEEDREKLYEAIISSPGVRYAVAVVSAQRIDEINILQATLEGMKMATTAVLELGQKKDKIIEENNVASAERNEISYVITGGSAENTKSTNYHALIDGNKVPIEMPCPAESMVQGDGREFAIAAASILAKVTRDRLMHEYDAKYPEYGLSRHKGYPTAAHMEVVKKLGASDIHRRTFAPLKHMMFDEKGKVLK